MAPKQNEYAKIVIGCKELGIDRKALVWDRYKVESMRDLNLWQTHDLLNHLNSQGFKPKRKKGSKASPKYKRADQRKVVAVWIELHKAGVVKDRSHKALNAFVKRHTKIADLGWCQPHDTMSLIEILKQWGARNDVDL